MDRVLTLCSTAKCARFINLMCFSRWNRLSHNPPRRISTPGIIRRSSFLIVYPLALLPYLQSLAVWLALGLAGYLTALWRIFPKPLTLWVGLAFPAVFWTVTHGQTSFLTTSLFCWGLLQLPRRPVLAGILFGVLIFKPHLGLLLPVALVAGGHWRAVVAAALTAIPSAVASVVLFGTGVWADFLASTSATRSMLESGLDFGQYYKMQSVFAAARLLGSPMLVAYSLQALVALGAAAAVYGSGGGRRATQT